MAKRRKLRIEYVTTVKVRAVLQGPSMCAAGTKSVLLQYLNNLSHVRSVRGAGNGLKSTRVPTILLFTGPHNKQDNTVQMRTMITVLTVMMSNDNDDFRQR